MFEGFKGKLGKGLRIITAAVLIGTGASKAILQQVSVPEENIKSPYSNSLDIRGGYKENLQKILDGKNYSDEAKAIVKAMFAALDENYDNYRQVEGGKSKNQIMKDYLAAVESCNSFILIPSQVNNGQANQILTSLGSTTMGVAYRASHNIIAKDCKYGNDKGILNIASHEFTHLIQFAGGFNVNPRIPFSNNLMQILLESDATDSSKMVDPPSLNLAGNFKIYSKDLSSRVNMPDPYNTYPDLLNIREKLEYLVGIDFFQKWQKDPDTEKDYFKEMGVIIDKKYGPGTFKSIFENLIQIGSFVDNGQIGNMGNDKITQRKSWISSDIYFQSQLLNRMHSKDVFINSIKSTLDYYDIQMKNNTKLLNNNNLLMKEYNKRSQGYKDSISYDQDEIKICSNEVELENYIQRLEQHSPFSFNTGYKQYIDNKIKMLKNPQERAKYIEGLEAHINTQQQISSTYTPDILRKNLHAANKDYTEASSKLNKYNDPIFYDAEIEDLKNSIRLCNDVSIPGLDKDVTDLLISFEEKIQQCIEKDIDKLNSKQGALDEINKWNQYKNLFTITEEKKQNGYWGSTCNFTLEEKLISKAKTLGVFRDFGDEELNDYTQRELIGSDIFDINTVKVKATKVNNDMATAIFDGNGILVKVSKFNKEKGGWSINSKNRDNIWDALPEDVSKTLQSTEAANAVNKSGFNSQKTKGTPTKQTGEKAYADR